MGMMKRLLQEDKEEDRWFVLPVLTYNKLMRKHNYSRTYRLCYRCRGGRLIEAKRDENYRMLENLAEAWNKENRVPDTHDSRWDALGQLVKGV